MKAHLIDTHLLVPRSRSFAKVKVKYQCHVSQKMGVSGALVFHKHILFSIVPLNINTIGQAMFMRCNHFAEDGCTLVPQAILYNMDCFQTGDQERVI